MPFQSLDKIARTGNSDFPNNWVITLAGSLDSILCYINLPVGPWWRDPFDPGGDDGDDDDGDDIDDDQNFDEELDHECFNKMKGIMVAIIFVLLWRASFDPGLKIVMMLNKIWSKTWTRWGWMTIVAIVHYMILNTPI